MARIRSIKPEFWVDERLARISRDARLLFIGLWNVADEGGRLRGSTLLIRAQVFPYDADVDVERLLVELEGGEFILRYSADGETYIWVRNFNKHQKTDPRLTSRLPPPPSHPIRTNKSGRNTKKRSPSREQVAGSREQVADGGAGAASPPPAGVVPVQVPEGDGWQALVDSLFQAFLAIKSAPYEPDKREWAELKKLRERTKRNDAEILARWKLGLSAQFKQRVDSFRDLNERWNALAGGAATGPPSRPVDVRKGMVMAQDVPKSAFAQVGVMSDF
jgi:hypothetical protein